jgi:hypothetical protein
MKLKMYALIGRHAHGLIGSNSSSTIGFLYVNIVVNTIDNKEELKKQEIQDFNATCSVPAATELFKFLSGAIAAGVASTVYRVVSMEC